MVSAARSLVRELPWERLDRISPQERVVTGDAPEEEAAPPAPTAVEDRKHHPLLGKPIVVLVHTDPDACEGDCRGACGRYCDLEDQVLSKEKVLLGLGAFRRIRMKPEDAATEPLLEGRGDALPRLVLIDVARDNVTVLSGSGVSASRVYKQLKKTADRFFKERLDSLVKKHVKMLDEHDKLAIEEQRLTEQISRATDDRKARKLEKKRDRIKDAQKDLDDDIEALWRLTLRDL